MQHEKHFSNLTSFAAFIDKANSSNSSYCNNRPDSFFGAGWDDALKMLKYGHKPGLANVSKAVDKISHKSEPLQQSYFFEQQGIMLDVGTYLTGEPEHWLELEPQKERKVYKILVNIGMLHNINTATIENRGAALIALIDKLQSDPNNIVELSVMSYAENVNNSDRVKITIDLGTSPLDMDSIAFVLAHPAFFRRFVFAARELILGHKIEGSIGATLQQEKNLIDSDTLYFKGGSKDEIEPMNSKFSNLDRAAKWIDRKIDSLFEPAA